MGDWRFDVVVFIVEEVGEHVPGGDVVFVTNEGEGAGECVLSQQLHVDASALAVAANDATDFPELDVVEEFSATDAYLAH